MNDSKLFAENNQQLQGLLKIVKQLSDDIQVGFGLDKCSKATFVCESFLRPKTLF